MREFSLMKEDARWWTLNDYGCVVDVTRRLNARTVLEFGPGSSTLALIEGGATLIDAMEDDDGWAEKYRARLQSVYPLIVRIHDYVWADPLHVHIAGEHLYDLALIDGPRETARRPAVVEFCLQRCASVLVPLECNEGSRLMREACQRLATETGRPLTTWTTGPLAGAFALIGPPC